MANLKSLSLLPITAIGIICSHFINPPVKAGSDDIGNKGANVYCFMRNSGNSHKVSWNASYEIIKRQKSSLFKTSPKHAAVMIIETVVSNPDEYQNCGNFLGDLFSPQDLDAVSTEIPTAEELDELPSERKKGDRYSY